LTAPRTRSSLPDSPHPISASAEPSVTLANVDLLLPHRREPVRTLLPLLLGARRVILTTHINADGDGAGCQAALAAWLHAHGVEARIINPTPFPRNLAFLLEDPSVVVDAAGPDARGATEGAGLALVVDTGEVPRIGRVKPLLDGLPLAVIDHHPVGEHPIGGASFRDAGATATGEMVYDLIRAAGGPWPRAVVEGLYVAIMTDTGGFRFANTSPSALRAAAELVERGASPEELHRRVYGTTPLRRLRLLEASLPSLHVEDGVGWMEVAQEAWEELGATPEDVEGFVDYPRAVEGVEVGLLFRRTREGGTKISLRSNGGVDVNAIARRFGGGGHVRASGALVEGGVEAAIPPVVEAVKEAVRALTLPEDAGHAPAGEARARPGQGADGESAGTSGPGDR
jgi:bifunctional oligoribonuclease and PAP phosphatase NrnA